MKRHTRPLILFLLLVLTGISARAQWTTQWQDTTNGRLQLFTLKFSGSTGYAGGWHKSSLSWQTTAMIYKTTDGGLNWDSIPFPQTIGSYTGFSIASILRVQSPDTLYIMAYGQDATTFQYKNPICKSTDGGLTWSVWHDPVNGSFGRACFVSRDEAYVFRYNNPNAFMDHTIDGGATWTSTTSQHNPLINAPRDFYMNASGEGTLVSDNNIQQTTDGGQHWNTIYTTSPFDLRSVCFTSANVGYAVGSSPNTYVSQVYKTTDGGTTWNPAAAVNHLVQGNVTPQYNYAIHFINDNVGYLSGTQESGYRAIYSTMDGGLTWTAEPYQPNSVFSQITAIAQSGNTLYAIDDSISYHAGFRIYTNTFSSNCSVSAGNDTTFCQQQGQLHATPGTPGNYLYSWSPSTGLDDPNSQDPTVTQGVSNQQYVVTMFDTANNCMATDTVLVSAYYVYLDTSYRCNNGVTLDLGPGGSFYTWMSYTDPSGNNSPINQQTQTYVANAAGTYYAGGTFPTCGSLTSMFTVIDSCFTFTCSVNAGNDTTFCQQQGQLHATPASPGNYTFSWVPSYGLDNPNIQNPSVVTGVVNQTYTVTMVDAANNCVAIDSVTVSAYYFHNDTTYTCNGQPVTLDFGPGATNYMWQFYTDTAGNTTVLNIQSQTLQVTQPGTYIGIALYPTCSALTSMFTVIDSCNVAAGNVWPGDCNYDLTANMADALHIGLGYGATGATRPNATPLWYAQPMNDWPQNFTNCNYKHADADGNGIIDVNDTLPIALNYSNTHPFRLGAPEQHIASAPDLYLVANYDTVGLQTLVTVDIRLGRTTLPVDSLYGISFRITADAPLIDTTMTDVNLGSTWLGTPGTNMFHFRKEFPSMGVIDIAECGNNHVNRLNGNGSIGSFLIVTTDNLSGIAVCHFHLSDITAVTTSQDYLLLNAVDDSVVINSSVPAGISWPETDAKKFSCYPNPAGNFVTVQTNAVAEQIEICDMTGRVLLTQTPGSKSTTIDTSALSEGIYLVRVRSGNSVATQKLTITH